MTKSNGASQALFEEKLKNLEGRGTNSINIIDRIKSLETQNNDEKYVRDRKCACVCVLANINYEQIFYFYLYTYRNFF